MPPPVETEKPAEKPAELNPENVLSNFASNIAKRAAELEKPGVPPEGAASPPDAPPKSQPAPETGTATAVPPAGEKADERDKWPRKAEDWKKFTEARDRGFRERDEKITALSKQIEELNARTAEASTSKELEMIKKERDELSDKVAMLNVVEHPKFKAYYDSKRQEQIAVAKALLGEHAADFEQLMGLPEGQYKEQQLEALVADLGPVAQGRVGAVLNNIMAIEAERQSQIANWRQNREAMQAEEERQRKAAEAKQQETTKQLRAEFDAAMLKVQDKTEGLAAFQKRGEPEWDDGVDKRVEYAKALFNGQVDKMGAFQAILHAAAFDGVASQAIALQKEVDRLNDVIKSMQASNPTIKPGGVADSDERTDEMKPGMRPDELAEAFFRNLQRKAQQ